ncbi:hypothetical protein BAUCODRAFT_148358 [Baudoinia panamericana UAMH 10762]|uniref:Uncharacterized protein n=1 Tax=Baudoinia panamericana (strain UAMH 10762) TaxID=717646 RepID=M2NC94_BAUPA|nr:uncharacterized protein BAUCODRAFT_148358 [Baudoinia panamericana UAMH 10762]EMC96804.1 hypothetical protein BAUCODRAFT_148358 [Baudoinia panamericana UAMH 10762]
MRAFAFVATLSVTGLHVVRAMVQPQLLEYNVESAFVKFSIPCPPATVCNGNDESLVFDIQLKGPIGTTNGAVLLNGNTLALARNEDNLLDLGVEGYLSANDTSGSSHSIYYFASHNLPSDGALGSDVTITLHAVDARYMPLTRLTVHSLSKSQPRLQRILLQGGGGEDFEGFSLVTDLSQRKSFVVPYLNQTVEDAMREAVVDDFNLEHELDSLRLLSAQAESLRDQIVAQKLKIAQYLKKNRGHVSLRDQLKDCDSLVCAARVVAQRMCDKISAITASPSGYARMHDARLQNTVAFQGDQVKPQQTSRNCTKSKAFLNGPKMPEKHTYGHAQRFNLSMTMTKNASSTEYQLVDLVEASNPLIRALQIVAAILGLTALYGFIRKSCMSMRTRVERAADREERRNARAYRKAARRAEMRRRWDDFVSAISCFRAQSEPQMQDYDEKRALILQDAFLEQLADLEQAEKGEIMEAEIRELRHAHDIVASLVRADERLAPMVNDPPPPLVPLPFTPETRSRASTNTLPSYTSESLPDYSSQPDTLVGSSTGGSIVDGFAGYTPTRTVDHDSDASEAARRYTPTSSVRETSIRASEDTMRTLQSRSD